MNDRISQCHSPTTHGWYLGLQPRSGASLLSTTDCLSQKQRRWPEDMAWHPEGKSIFSVYNADDGDSQISSLNLNRTKGVFIYAYAGAKLGYDTEKNISVPKNVGYWQPFQAYTGALHLCFHLFQHGHKLITDQQSMSCIKCISKVGRSGLNHLHPMTKPEWYRRILLFSSTLSRGLTTSFIFISIFGVITVTGLLHVCSGDVGRAGQYEPPYLPTACYGNDMSQFPPSNLFASAGDGIWDNGAACGRQYSVRCLSAQTPGTCKAGQTIKVKIVDRASRNGVILVLSTIAFRAIANPSAALVNIEFAEA